MKTLYQVMDQTGHVWIGEIYKIDHNGNTVLNCNSEIGSFKIKSSNVKLFKNENIQRNSKRG